MNAEKLTRRQLQKIADSAREQAAEYLAAAKQAPRGFQRVALMAKAKNRETIIARCAEIMTIP
jgi:hypothetical protein